MTDYEKYLLLNNQKDGLNLDMDQNNITTGENSLNLGQFLPQKEYTMQDADTVNNSRIMNYDAPETYLDSKKAKKLLDMGVDAQTMLDMGNKAKEDLNKLLPNANFQEQGTGYYGRPLLQSTLVEEEMVKNLSGVPTDRYNQKLQNLYRSNIEKKEKLGLLTQEESNTLDTLRGYNIDRQAPTFSEKAGNAIDAFQSGTVQAAGKFGDFVSDIASWGAEKIGADKAAEYLDKFGETMASQKYADEVAGFTEGRKEQNFVSAEVDSLWERGKYLDAITTGLKEPSYVAESLPIMIEMFLGGGKLKAGAQGLKKLGGLMKQNAGFGAVVAQETNAQAEEFEEKYGYKPSPKKLAEMALMNTLTFSLDKLAFSKIVGLKGSLDIPKEALTPKFKNEFMNKALTKAGGLTAAGVGEGAQEYIQTWGEILNVSDTDMEGYFKQFENKDKQREARLGGILGLTGGIQMRGAVELPKSVKDIAKAAYDSKLSKDLREQQKNKAIQKFRKENSTEETKSMDSFFESIKNNEEYKGGLLPDQNDLKLYNEADNDTKVKMYKEAYDIVKRSEKIIEDFNNGNPKNADLNEINKIKNILKSTKYKMSLYEELSKDSVDREKELEPLYKGLENNQKTLDNYVSKMNEAKDKGDTKTYESMKKNLPNMERLVSNIQKRIDEKQPIKQNAELVKEDTNIEMTEEEKTQKELEDIMYSDTQENNNVEQVKDIIKNKAGKPEEYTKEEEQIIDNASKDGTLQQANKELAEEVKNEEVKLNEAKDIISNLKQDILNKNKSKIKTFEKSDETKQKNILKSAEKSILDTEKKLSNKNITEDKKIELETKLEEVKVLKEEFESKIKEPVIEETKTETKIEETPVKEVKEVKKEVVEKTPIKEATKEVEVKVEDKVEEVKTNYKKLIDKHSKSTTKEKYNNIKTVNEKINTIENELNENTNKDIETILTPEEITNKEQEIEDLKVLKEELNKDINVYVPKNKKVEIVEDSRDKGLVHDVTKITNSVINNIFETGTKIADIVKSAKLAESSKYSDRIGKPFYKNERNPIRPKLEEIKEIGEKELNNGTLDNDLREIDITFDNLTNEEKSGLLLRALAIAGESVLSATNSERVSFEKAGLKLPNQGFAKVPGMAKSIGQKYINSLGSKLKGNAKEIDTEYHKIGNAILNIAEKTGIIELNEGFTVASRIVLNGKETSERLEFEKAGYNIKEEDGVLMIKNKIATLKDISNGQEGKTYISENGEALSKLYLLIKPVQYEMVRQTPTDEVLTDRKVSEDTENIIKKYEKVSFKVKPEFLTLLRNIKNSIKQTSMDSAFNNNDFLKLLTKEDNKYVADIYETNEATKSINIKDTIRSVLDNLDDIEEMSNKGFYYQSEMAINGRIHLMQTVLQFQNDKRFSRQVVGGETYTTNGEIESEILFDGLAEELKISADDIKEGNYPKELKDILDRFSTKKDNLKYNEVESILNGMESVLPKAQFEPFLALNVFYGLSDVYNSKDINKITTNFQVEQDMKASGVSNTLSNLSGNPIVQKTLGLIGIDPKNEYEALRNEEIKSLRDKFIKLGLNTKRLDKADRFDPYLLLVNQFLKDFDINNKENVEVVNTLKLLEEIGMDLRNLAKPPVMTWFYGQLGANNANNLSKEIVKSMLESNNANVLKYINSKLGTKFNDYDSETNSIKDISNKQVKDLVNSFNESFSNKFVKSLDNAFPGVQEYRSTMDSIYETLIETGKWDGTVESAISAMQRAEAKAKGKDKDIYRMSLKKLKEVSIYDPEMQEYVTYNEKLNNKTSFFVNFQHSTDAAQLLLTMQYALNDKKIDDGLMAIHDAMYMKANDVVDINNKFDENVLNSALQYDFVSIALNELKNSISKVKDVKLKDKLTKKYDKLKTENDVLVKQKEAFLTGADIKLFGLDTSHVKRDSYIEKLNRLFDKEVGTVANKQQKRAIINFLKDLDISFMPKYHKGLIEKIINTLEGNVDIVFDTNFKSSGSRKNGKLYLNKEDMLKTENGLKSWNIVQNIAHEIDHVLKNNYIRNNFNNAEVKYFRDFLSKMKSYAKSNPSILEENKRFAYILNPLTQDEVSNRAKILFGESNLENNLRTLEMAQVEELIAISSSEKRDIQAIFRALYPKDKNDTVVQKAIKKFKAIAQKMFDKIRQNLFNMNENELAHNLHKIDNSIFEKLEFANEVLSNRAEFWEIAISKQDKGVDIISNLSALKQIEKTTMDTIDLPFRVHSKVADMQINYIRALIDLYGTTALDLVAPYIKTGHNLAKNKFMIYAATLKLMDRMFNRSSFAQRTKEIIGANYDSSKDFVNKLLGLKLNIDQGHKKILDDVMPKLDRKLRNNYNEQELEKIYNLIARTGFPALADNNPKILLEIIKGKLTIEQAITKLTKNLKTNNKQGLLSELDLVASFAFSGVITDGMENVMHTSTELVDLKTAESLIALKAMKKIKGIDSIMQSMDKELYRELISIGTSIKSLHDEIYTLDNNYSPNYINDIYKENDEVEIKYITAAELANNKYEENGWILLDNPTNNKYGRISRRTISPGYVDGVGASLQKEKNGFYLSNSNPTERRMLIELKKLKKTDKTKYDQYLNDNQLIEEGNKYRAILSSDMKEKIGIEKNTAQVLYKTFIHNSAVLDTNIIRKTIVQEGTDKISNLDELNDLVNTIKSNEKNKDNVVITPSFLKLDFEYGDYELLPKEIKDKYEPAKKLSNIDNFKNNITLVKKAQKDILLGHDNFSFVASAASFFGIKDRKDIPREFMMFERIFKELISLAKIHMVVLSPVKLLGDMTSNLVTLLTIGVNPSEIKKDFAESLKHFKSFSKLRNELVVAKMKLKMHGTSSKEVDSIITKMENHPFFPAYKAGFVQSYSTDLTLKDYDTTTGLQNDIDKIVESVTKDSKGNPNLVFKTIDWWRRFGEDKGFTVDHLFASVGSLAKQKGISQGEAMIEFANRIKEKKNDKDSVARYVSEFIGAPSSELVNIGGAVMITADLSSKYIAAKHFMRNGMSEKEAYDRANDIFIDYRSNIPKELKALSDFGIIPFANFLLKVQKALYSLAKYQPASALNAYILADLLEAESNTILHYSLIEKYLGSGGILKEPFSIAFDTRNISPIIL